MDPVREVLHRYLELTPAQNKQFHELLRVLEQPQLGERHAQLQKAVQPPSSTASQGRGGDGQSVPPAHQKKMADTSDQPGTLQRGPRPTSTSATKMDSDSSQEGAKGHAEGHSQRMKVEPSSDHGNFLPTLQHKAILRAGGSDLPSSTSLLAPSPSTFASFGMPSVQSLAQQTSQRNVQTMQQDGSNPHTAFAPSKMGPMQSNSAGNLFDPFFVRNAPRPLFGFLRGGSATASTPSNTSTPQQTPPTTTPQQWPNVPRANLLATPHHSRPPRSRTEMEILRASQQMPT